MLLTLGRRTNEKIIMTLPDGQLVEITPSAINGFNGKGQVRLQFEAPECVKIDREEIYKAKKQSGTY